MFSEQFAKCQLRCMLMSGAVDVGGPVIDMLLPSLCTTVIVQ